MPNFSLEQLQRIRKWYDAVVRLDNECLGTDDVDLVEDIDLAIDTLLARDQGPPEEQDADQ